MLLRMGRKVWDKMKWEKWPGPSSQTAVGLSKVCWSLMKGFDEVSFAFYKTTVERGDRKGHFLV